MSLDKFLLFYFLIYSNIFYISLCFYCDNIQIFSFSFKNLNLQL